MLPASTLLSASFGMQVGFGSLSPAPVMPTTSANQKTRRMSRWQCRRSASRIVQRAWLRGRRYRRQGTYRYSAGSSLSSSSAAGSNRRAESTRMALLPIRRCRRGSASGKESGTSWSFPWWWMQSSSRGTPDPGHTCAGTCQQADPWRCRQRRTIFRMPALRAEHNFWRVMEMLTSSRILGHLPNYPRLWNRRHSRGMTGWPRALLWRRAARRERTTHTAWSPSPLLCSSQLIMLAPSLFSWRHPLHTSPACVTIETSRAPADLSTIRTCFATHSSVIPVPLIVLFPSICSLLFVQLTH